ncbi:MAG: Hpt domain-containing protein [Novosphingobium sp.]|nr:Hpt domain-containing protein [Novosphingobium sp.]
MSALEDRLVSLKARFLERARDDLRTFEAIDTSAPMAECDRQNLVNSSHKLAGLSGTLGYSEISAAASALESALISGAGEHSFDAELACLKQVLHGATKVDPAN